MTIVDTVTGEVIGRRTLAECEAVVEKGLDTFVEVGAALMEIRDGRLYRDTFDNFEAYCLTRWGFNRTYAHRLISASEVAEMLPIGNRPSNEAQARELASLKDQPEQMAEVWNEANDRAEAAGRKVTAKDLERMAEEKRARSRPEPTEAEQREADLAEGDRRAARALEKVIENWPYLERLGRNPRRGLILAALTEPDREALARIEEQLR